MIFCRKRTVRRLADHSGIVYTICSFLPVLGLLTVFLPGKKDLRVA